MDIRSPFFSNLALALAGILALNPIVATAAQLTVDAAAGGNTSLGQAGNGVPMVNIATPNGKGLSHNKFTDYNVGQQGLILNNATGRTQSTQLGGIIVGNPNLNGRAAGMILNEVTGSNVSQLKGYTEVAGQAARVIVANPHGITCDGCGFINTPRVSLSTGKPIIDNGMLDRFDVDGGYISVEGAGLNAGNIDQFDLITRSARINAELHAQQLNVVAGRSNVKADSLAATAKADDGRDRPQLAIDSSALGGMYAGAIRLVGTEQGVGVKLAGNMAASGGDIRIDVNGKLSLAQTVSSGNLQASAQSLDLAGQAYAAGNVNLQAREALTNRQSLAAAGDIVLSGQQLDNQGIVEAGVNPDNSRNGGANLMVSGQNVRNSGTLLANRDLQVHSMQSLDNQGGTLSGGAALRIDAGQLNNQQGKLLSDGQLQLTAGALDNQRGLVVSHGELTAQIEHLDNGRGEMASHQSANLRLGALDNTAGTLLAEGGLSLQVREQAKNQGGVLSGRQGLDIEAAGLDNSHKGSLVSQGPVTVKVAGLLDNSGEGNLISQRTLSIQAGELDNRGEGAISSQGNLHLEGHILHNQGGAILSSAALQISGVELDNSQAGLISSKGDASLEVARIVNREAGSLVAEGTLRVQARQLDNATQGEIASQGNLTVVVDELEQQGGSLISQGALELQAAALDNSRGGLIAANQGIRLSTTTLNNSDGGEISSRGRVALSAGELNNSNAGQVIANTGLELSVQRLLNHSKGMLSGREGLSLSGGSLDNRGGTLSGRGPLVVELNGPLLNRDQGALLSEGRLIIKAGSLDNAGGVLSSAGEQRITVGDLHNAAGKLLSDASLDIASQSLDNSQGGSISAKGDIGIVTGDFDNSGSGALSSAGALTLDAGHVNNGDRGRIASKGALSAQLTGLEQSSGGELISETSVLLDLAGGHLNNSQQGLIATPGSLLLRNVGSVDNSQGGELSSSQSFTLQTGDLNNAGGLITSGTDLQVLVSRALHNSLKGTLSAARNLHVEAAALDNSSGGTLASGTDLYVVVQGGLDNHGQGALVAGRALQVQSGSLDNSGEGLLNAASVVVETGELNNNQGGLIHSGGQLQLVSGRLDNSGGELSAKGDLYLTVQQLIQRQGRLIGEGALHLDLQNGELDNRGGLLAARGPLTLANLRALDNRERGEISSERAFSLLATTLDNGDQGLIVSAETLSVQAQSLRNAQGGLLTGWQGLEVRGGQLDNSSAGTLSSREGALDVVLTGALHNQEQGALVSRGDLRVEADSLDNSRQGILSTDGDLRLAITAGLLNAEGGLVAASGNLEGHVTEIDNRAGQLSAGQDVHLTGNHLDNRAGQLSAQGGLSLELLGNLNNSNQARIGSGGPLLIVSAGVDNRAGQLVSQGLLSLIAGSFDNSTAGTLAAREALSLDLSGALNNSQDGLIYSQADTLDIQAASFDNRAGTLQSQGDMTVATEQALLNQGGRLLSQDGNLDLRASRIDNSGGGILSSMLGWLKLAIGGLFDNSNGVTQAQSLDIAAQEGVNNHSGHLSALTDGVRIETQDFDNRNGGLYAHGLLTLTGRGFDNSGSTGGKVAAGHIDFSLAGALNNQLGLIESDTELQLAAASLDNRQGALRALGSGGQTRIATQAGLDNRGGSLETANFDLDLNVVGLQNANGKLLHVGNGTFKVASANVIQAGGSLVSNGALTLNANSWANSSLLQAGRLTLNVGTFSQTASGQLLASQSLDATGGDWTNHGLIASDGSLNLNLSGTYSGDGHLTSLGDLELAAGAVRLASIGRIASGGNLSLTSASMVDNAGRLTATHDFILRAATLNNTGTLGGAGNLALYATTLHNEGGLIFSGGDMALRANAFTNRYADVYSLGKLDIAANDQGGRASQVSNISGTLESAANFSINADLIENKRDIFSFSSALYTARLDEQWCVQTWMDCSGPRRTSWYELTQRDKLEVTAASRRGEMLAGGDMSLLGGGLVNEYSLISSGGSLSANLASLSNIGLVEGVIETTRMFRLTRASANTRYNFQDEVAAFNNRYWYTESGYTASSVAVLPSAVHAMISRSRFEEELTYLNTSKHLSSGDQRYTGTIQAGGAVNLNVAKTIELGVVKPGYTHVALAKNLNDVSVGGAGIATPITLNSQLPSNLQQQQVNPLALPGFSLPQSENGLFRLSGQGGQTVQAQGTQEDYTLGGRSVAVDTRNQAVDFNGAEARAFDVAAGDGALNAPVADATLIPSHTLPRVQGVPEASRPASGHKYLIETNPALTDLKQFMGSDYLLGNLGVDPDLAQKRLGDGLYEQRLIREAVVARTGARYLDGMNSDEDMFRYLMDNAIASKDELNLSVGVGLTAEQVAALTHDIVWLEEHEVMGEKVLIPVLYLAQADGRLMANGALIQGQDVTLISGGELNNQGTLKASGSLAAIARNIENTGLLEANERLQLLADESIRNAQAGIIAGRDVSLTALTGDVINERTVTRQQGALGNRTWENSVVDSAARIEALGSLNISAGRDIANLGGVLDGKGDVSLLAGRDVTIAAVEERYAQSAGSRFNTESITQIGAQVSAGGNLAISAGSDFSVIASDVQAGQSLGVSAGNDVLIASAANESHRYSKSSKVTSSSDTVTQVSSSLQAGGDMALSAGNDLALVASQLKADGSVALDAEQDISVLSALDESASFYSKKSDGSFGRSKTVQKESYDSTNVASVIEAGQDLTINTRRTADGGLSINGGRDVTVIGSQLKAGSDLLIGATGDVAVLSGVEEHGAYSKTTKSSTFGLSKSGKSQLTTTASQVASELGAGNDVVIAAGSSIGVRASEIFAGNDAELRAGLIDADGDINLVSAADTAYSRSERYRQKVGVSTAKGSMSFASAKEAGQEAYSSTSVGSHVGALRDATLQAERDINVVGSAVSAGRDVDVDAGRDVNVVAAVNSSTERNWEQNKQIGISVTSDDNGVSLFAGAEKTDSKDRLVQDTAAASQITAGRNQEISARRDIRQVGSDLQALNDLSLLAGRDIHIDAADETLSMEQFRSTERQGLGVSANHNFGRTKDAVENAGEGDNNVSKVSGVLRAADSLNQFFAGPTADVRVGNSRQSASQQSIEQSHRGSTLASGNDLTLTAGNDVSVRGSRLNAGRDIVVLGRDVTFDVAQGSFEEDTRQRDSSGGVNAGTSGGPRLGVGGSLGKAEGNSSQDLSSVTQLGAGRDLAVQASHDLTLVATQAQSGRDLDLQAGNDLTIRAAQNDSSSENTRRSGGGEVGLSIGSAGVGGYVSVNLGRGDFEREGAKQQDAYLYAGGHLAFGSRRDTTVSGAQLNGETVAGRVGRDLRVSSVADTGRVDGREWDVSATVSTSSLSGSVGYGKTTGKTDWVDTQTSITARGGLDIRTENHTQLDGALLASQTGDLLLDTGSLGFSDFQGRDKEHGYYANVGLSVGQDGNVQQDASQVGKGDTGVSGWSAEGYDYRKDREQIVRATVGDGEIVVRSDTGTGHDSTEGLNRDVEKAYEITKDDEERTDLYVSESSLESVGEVIESPTIIVEKTLEIAKSSLDAVTNAANRVAQEIQAQRVGADQIPEAAKQQLGEERALAMAKNLVRNGLSPELMETLTPEQSERLSGWADAAQNYNAVYEDVSSFESNGVNISLHPQTAVEDFLFKTYEFQQYLGTLPVEEAQLMMLGMQALLGPAKAAVSVAGNVLLNAMFGDELDALKEQAAIGMVAGLTDAERQEVEARHAYAKQEYAAGNTNYLPGSLGVLASEFLIDLAAGNVGSLVGKGVGKSISVVSSDRGIAEVNSEKVDYFRVEGGGSGSATSQNRITVNPDGTININSSCSGQLCVSVGKADHASYYLTNRRADGSVVVFEVDASLHKQIMDSAVPQHPIPGAPPRDPSAPKIVDASKPGLALELPKVWDSLLERHSGNARIYSQDEFLKEFGK